MRIIKKNPRCKTCGARLQNHITCQVPSAPIDAGRGGKN